MFQPETEDMIPRAAPKPYVSASTANLGAITQPTVPEVSLLINQPQNLEKKSAGIVGQNLPVNTPTTESSKSYMAWKKNFLPVVSFTSTVTNKVFEPTPVDPAQTGRTVPLNGYNQESREVQFGDANLPSNALTIAMEELKRHVDSRFQRSLPLLTQESPKNTVQFPRQSDVCRDEVLTLCAGCQTDPVSFTESLSQDCNAATRQEFNKLYQLIEDIRKEQCLLRQFIENSCLVIPRMHSSASAHDTREAEVQCELLVSNNVQTDKMCDIFKTMEPKSAKNDNRIEANATKAQCSPKPRAEYMQKETLTIFQKVQEADDSDDVISLPKPNTEKSFVMNELALKYLPPNKITELMEDLCHLQTPNKVSNAIIPLRSIENCDRKANEISNASYRYLQKYRLLANENEVCYQRILTETPIRIQRNNQKQCLNEHLSPPVNRPAQLLDLENIRNQPKYL